MTLCLQCKRRPSERFGKKYEYDKAGTPLFSRLTNCPDPIHDDADNCVAMREALERYRQFARDIMEAVWEGAVEEAWLQEHAEEVGIIEKVIGGFDPSKHHDYAGVCETGDTFYMLEELAALAREEEKDGR